MKSAAGRCKEHQDPTLLTESPIEEGTASKAEAVGEHRLASHPVGGVDTQQIKAPAKYPPSRRAQGQTRSAHLSGATQHRALLIEHRVGTGQLVQVGAQLVRGQVLGHQLDDLTELREQQGQLLLGGLVKNANATPNHCIQVSLGVNVRVGLGGCLAQDL